MLGIFTSALLSPALIHIGIISAIIPRGKGEWMTCKQKSQLQQTTTNQSDNQEAKWDPNGTETMNGDGECYKVFFPLWDSRARHYSTNVTRCGGGACIMWLCHVYIYITYHMVFWHTLSLSLSYSRRILHIVTAPHLADVYTSILNGQTVYSVVFVFRIFFVVVFSGCTQLPRMLWHCRWWPVFLHVIWSFACIFNFALVCEAARNDVWRVLGVWGW